MSTTLQRPRTPAPRPAPTHGAEEADVQAMLRYVLAGMLLGIVLYKAEVVYWQRINEMFRFQSFHMYGVLGSALLTAFISLRLLARFQAKARTGERIALAPKELNQGHRYWIGGSIFGGGWALCGACPGPLFVLIGSGATVFTLTAVAALAGTWTYGVLRPRLPH